ncbi:DUF2059 domain-containing protein [Massilia horti]|uniref:DUF2059 domain-containing protein n=1 Tax=Massilia horti TaxID=2562153 RepID=A0A4Y9T6L7_9BURK|nr:DUF2059 domain-containing protein [Massilia horti]TFW34489.1 DUF2059 domain-containing protein [Massilia horti]
MKKYLVALAVVVFTGAASFAQAAPAFDPAVAQATKQMFASMKMRDVLVASIKQAELAFPGQVRQMMTSMINNDASLTAERQKEALAKIEKVLPTLEARTHEIFSDQSMIDEILEQSIPVYASIYTVDEIHQLSAFYHSPLGQKMLANTSKLSAESIGISNRVMMPRLEKLMAQIVQSIVDEQP